MKLVLKIIIGVLLIFNGIGAIYGGLSLIRFPDGSDLQLPEGYLQNSPFSNYLIPGIILFVGNGLFSFFVLTTLILKFRKYTLFVIAQGSILLGWILIQIYFVRDINPLHIIMGSTGLLLILFGYVLHFLHPRSNQAK